MEPLLLSATYRHREAIADLALDLARKSAGFRRSLPPGLIASLADLVRSMNCYYSNLIEGHDTHPIDIERALKDDYSANPKQRDLQLEARAHIAVQKRIDEGAMRGGRELTPDGIREIHREFCNLLPADLLWVEESTTKERHPVAAGELRTRDVMAGSHVAISAAAVPRFLQRFAQGYGGTGKAESIAAIAAAHHRLLWIHPFLDGNGRVARLVSHARLLETLETGALWSVARGLARNARDYKSLLANCDQPRRHDLDGSGTLSEEALGEFTQFFLKVCIDQVEFMENLMQPGRIHARILLWTEEEIRVGGLPPRSNAILEALLFRGELPRGDAAATAGIGDRHGRRVVAALLKKNVLVSDGPRAPLRLAFPASLASRWMPGLFPDQ